MNMYYIIVVWARSCNNSSIVSRIFSTYVYFKYGRANKIYKIRVHVHYLTAYISPFTTKIFCIKFIEVSKRRALFPKRHFSSRSCKNWNWVTYFYLFYLYFIFQTFRMILVSFLPLALQLFVLFVSRCPRFIQEARKAELASNCWCID